MSDRIEKVVINPFTPISEAITILDRSGLGVLLVCDEDRHLIGVITDGDIRRAMMRSISFKSNSETIANRDPVVAPASTSHEKALQLMDHAKDFFVNHLPLVDEQNRIKDLLLRSDFTPRPELGLSAVVMAGGFGLRLRPLTENLPKPMLPVGDRPILETVISQLRDAGIKKLRITTHYKPEKIHEHFGNGKNFGLDISYLNEEQPLGTAGALRLMESPQEPFLVLNGDVLTKVNFEAMFLFHKENNSEITVGVREQEFQIPYGVVECRDTRIEGLKEKPVLSFMVNAGIYLLEPSVIKYIPENQTFHMTDLIQTLMDNDLIVNSFPIHEYWTDIGQHRDYNRANDEYPKKFGKSIRNCC